jgi:hypothetical protein
LVAEAESLSGQRFFADRRAAGDAASGSLVRGFLIEVRRDRRGQMVPTHGFLHSGTLRRQVAT